MNSIKLFFTQRELKGKMVTKLKAGERWLQRDKLDVKLVFTDVITVPSSCNQS